MVHVPLLSCVQALSVYDLRMVVCCTSAVVNNPSCILQVDAPVAFVLRGKKPKGRGTMLQKYMTSL